MTTVKPKSTSTLRITPSRKALAETIALTVSNECQRIVKISDILNFVIDKHLNNETAQEYIAELKQQRGIK
ncbi:hypothetical protein [Gilliamella sp. BG6]|uniref:hypothetical protein n=1 Tax=unclassified Gilliamella TaxID=2685620 RepID=UPI00398664AA